MTPAALKAKWLLRFADNDTFNIDEADLREFVSDLQSTFIDNPAAITAVLASLGRGLKGPFVFNAATVVKAGEWWLTDSGIWEGLRDFTANALPVPGANWKRVVQFSTFTAEQAIAAVRSSNLINGRVQVVHANGEKIHYATWAEAHEAAEDGDEIVFGPGNFGTENADAVIQKNLSIRLSPGTVWVFRNLYLHTYYSRSNPRTIRAEGGTLRGVVYAYAEIDLDFTLRGVTHEGSIFYSSYTSAGAPGNALPIRMRLQNVRAVCAAGDYITAYTRNQGFYFRPLQVVVEQSTIQVTAGAVYHNTGAGGNPSDAEGNGLRIHDSTLLCAADQAIIVAPDDVVGYDFAQVAYTGLVPAGVSSRVGYSFLGMPAGGVGGAGSDLSNYYTKGQSDARYTIGTEVIGQFSGAGSQTATLPIYDDAAGTYTLYSSNGVSSVSYQKNGVAAALPVALAAGDVLSIQATGSGTVRLRKQA